ncbi:MAG: hypothetical protein ACRDG5_05955 [Anaerolineales bacterium]
MELQPLTRRPGFRTAAGIVLAAIGYGLLSRAADAGPGLAVVALDLLLFLACLILTLAVASQFVLPVHRMSERAASVRRLFGYLTGERGPVMFIEDGRAVEGHRDRRRGPGVLLIGQASAAVLRTDVSFTRAVGPGVVFTAPGERLAEALDLRRQVRRLRGRSARPSPTETLTRDGIPISADLSVTFMLDPGHTYRPREGSHPALPPFEFHPQSAVRAVYGHAYGESQDVPWTELPLRLAADLWRERVKTRPLSAWLGPESDIRRTLSEVRAELLNRLQGPVAAEGAARAAARGEDREAQLLRARGIRVLDFQVGNIYLPDEVRQERIQQWQGQWAAAHEQELVEVRALDESLRRQAIQESARTLAGELTAGLRRRLAEGNPPGLKDTLLEVARDALRLAENPDRAASAGPLAAHLRAMVDEVTVLGPEGQSASGGQT